MCSSDLWFLSNLTGVIDTRTNQNLVDNNASYYTISTPYTSNYYKFTVTKTIIGSNTAALGGITFFDSIGRVTPAISSSTQLVSASSIRGGRVAQSIPVDVNVRWDNCYGALTLGDGRRVVGDWRGDKLNGRGLYVWPDGRVYLGEFVNDQRQGDRKSTRLNSSHIPLSRMPSSA